MLVKVANWYWKRNQEEFTGIFSIANNNDYCLDLSMDSHLKNKIDMLKLNLIVRMFPVKGRNGRKEGEFCLTINIKLQTMRDMCYRDIMSNASVLNIYKPAGNRAKKYRYENLSNISFTLLNELKFNRNNI